MDLRYIKITTKENILNAKYQMDLKGSQETGISCFLKMVQYG